MLTLILLLAVAPPPPPLWQTIAIHAGATYADAISTEIMRARGGRELNPWAQETWVRWTVIPAASAAAGVAMERGADHLLVRAGKTARTRRLVRWGIRAAVIGWRGYCVQRALRIGR